MFQVTIIWQGVEIGYGEGESIAYAKAEAIESVGSFYDAVRNEWQVTVKRAA